MQASFTDAGVLPGLTCGILPPRAVLVRCNWTVHVGSLCLQALFQVMWTHVSLCHVMIHHALQAGRPGASMPSSHDCCVRHPKSVILSSEIENTGAHTCDMMNLPGLVQRLVANPHKLLPISWFTTNRS